MKRKLLSLLIAAMLLFNALVGCSKTDSSNVFIDITKRDDILKGYNVPILTQIGNVYLNPYPMTSSTVHISLDGKIMGFDEWEKFYENNILHDNDTLDTSDKRWEVYENYCERWAKFYEDNTKYNDDYFKENALIFLNIGFSYYFDVVNINSLIKNRKELSFNITVFNYNDVLRPMTMSIGYCVEVKKKDVSDINIVSYHANF
ncbi:MAG: hypothetical protein FWH14_05920 [Oscillospiraceae bacterium]|nr:hypothetical protein [Oscillospiraceae bacterium]